MNYYKSLNVGWKIDDNFHPIIKKTNTGLLSNLNLISINPAKIAKHTAIIAQSGSGKSFFLGRLVEEILLKTKCNCLILDPNADFKKCYDLVKEEYWNNISYSKKSFMGRLPTEKSSKSFFKKWKNISKCVFSNSPLLSDPTSEKINFWWQTINIDLISENLPEIQKTQLFYCHKLLDIMEFIYFNKYLKNIVNSDFFEVYKNIFFKSKDLNTVQFIMYLDGQFISSSEAESLDLNNPFLSSNYSNYSIQQLKVLISEICELIDPVSFSFYSSKYMQFFHNNLLLDDFENYYSSLKKYQRLRVYDLPSILNKNLRLLLVNCILNNELYKMKTFWEKALELSEEEDKRSPMFVIVDEAHNLMPRETNDKFEKIIRDQFRTIAAEGRKYGLFLIVVSQRPDKIDQKVLSECSNYVVMKVNNKNILKELFSTFNIENDDEKQFLSCLKFPKGRFLLGGSWANGKYLKGYTAMRRCYEGGRNLNKKYWSVV